uniref:RNA binding motif protein 12 n=3 Tax=Salmo trutta TaxID=8032 RepID=A0A674B0N9_SALTR
MFTSGLKRPIIQFAMIVHLLRKVCQNLKPQHQYGDVNIQVCVLFRLSSMAVVIRLQGLPIVAGTMDIRHFFSGLTIPDGEVHIVGGKRGEAFIVFATDEDARLGMMRTRGAIKGTKVSLLLSSKTEMQNILELRRRRFKTGKVGGAAGNGSRPGPTVNTCGRGSLPNTLQGFSNTRPATITTAASAHETISNRNVSTFATTSMGNMPPSFSNNFSSPNLTMESSMRTAMSSLNSVPPPIHPLTTMPPMPSIPLPPPVSSVPPVPTVSPLTQGPPVLPMSLSHMGSMPPFNPGVPPPSGLAPSHMFVGHMNPLLNLQAQMKAAIGNSDELYVHLQGLPFSASERDIREIFCGLGVDSIRLVRDNFGRSCGWALAKFFSPQDTFEALKRSSGMLRQRYVDISPATESQWMSVSSDGNGVGVQAHSKSSNMPQDQHRRSNMSSASPSTSDHARSRSPHKEFYLYLKGLPYEVVNKQICEFFKNLDVMEDRIYIAYGPTGRATGEGFVQLRNEIDYKAALSYHRMYMGNRFIQVQTISKEAMFEKIDSIRQRMQGVDKKNSESGKSPRNCAHISNMPYNVSKEDVHLFLEGIAVVEESLKVLVDSSGKGLGQAVVQLSVEEDVLNAERRHRQKLNGRNAFVHLVTFEEMKEIERNPPPQVKRVKRSQKFEGNSQGQAQYMGSQFIQVQTISKKAMFEKIDSVRQRMQGVDKKNSESGKSPRNCAHISNIPYNVSKEDVHLFLEGIAVVEESLKVLVDSSGNGLGQAVVQFRVEEDALNAEKLHRQKLNGRDAFVRLVTFEEMKEIERNPPPQDKRVKRGLIFEGNSQGQAHGHAQAQNPIQAQAFAGITGEEFNFLRNTVGNLGNGPFPQFTVPGNGLVGPPPPPFSASLENVALSIPPPMVAGHLPGAVLAPPSFRPQFTVPGNGLVGPPPPPFSASLENVALSIPPPMVAGHLPGAVLAPPSFRPQFTVPGNGLVGPPPPPFAASLENVALSIPPPMVAGHLPGAVLAPPSFQPGINNGPPGFGPEGLRGRPPFDNGSRKSGGHNRGSGQGRSEVRPQSALVSGPGSDPLRGQSTGGPGNPRGPTIVKIQNMPFTVTVDEILDFFYGYQVLPGSVCQQLSEKGLPTGEAMVAFESHEEASSAVMDLNDRPIGASKVKITIG